MQAISIHELFEMAKKHKIPYYRQKSKAELCRLLGLDIKNIASANQKRCKLTDNKGSVIYFSGLNNMSKEIGLSVHATKQRLIGKIKKGIEYEGKVYFASYL